MNERIGWIKENTNTFLRKLSNGEKIKKMNFGSKSHAKLSQS